jgi:2-polyprenyl-3-methyl-5-hydroxy-6-metoxy-1,4-benzoquinol methylase
MSNLRQLRPLEMEAVACGACGAIDGDIFAEGKDYEYGTSPDTFRLVRCGACGNVYLNPRPVSAELGTIYPPNYYSYNYEEAVNPIASRAKHVLDGLKARSWLKHSGAGDSLSSLCFLDVGCGDGRYLKMLHQRGARKENLYGVEMDAEGMARLTEKGYQAFSGRIEDIVDQLPQASFDLIVILQVLEHVENPRATIGKLSQLLREGGLLIVETPNTESFDARVFRKSYWGGYHFPRHWNLFNPEVLRMMAEGEQLCVKAFNYLPAHSFWIFSFHHLLSERTRLRKLARFFNPLRNLPLLAVVTGFDMLRARLGFTTSNVQMVAVKSTITAKA